MTTKPSDPPDDLGPAGRDLWVSMQAAYEFSTAEERQLVEAARTADELADLTAALRTSTAIIKGSAGQDKANPLFAEIRAHRAALAALLQQLKPAPEPDRRTVSQKRSDAALSRYGRLTRVQ